MTTRLAKAYPRRHVGLAAIVLSAAAGVGEVAAAGEQSQQRIFITIATGGSIGALVAMDRESPWTVTPIANLDSAQPIVQSAFGRIFTIEPEADRVRVFDGQGNQLCAFTVGAGTQPRDIFCANHNRAYITRANATHLYRVDPQTGQGEDVIDLGPLADADGVPDMERMASDGERLYVQLRRVDSNMPWLGGPGAIAIVDLATEALVDANPSTPEVDAIELAGPSARLRMHIASNGAYLLVSATSGNHLNFDGGLEYVNLGTLASEGFVVAEIDLAAMGGFAMVDDERGYFLFHTDIIASNHLKSFTIAGGSDPASEIVFDAGTYLDVLLIDPATALLYMPASAGGVYIVNTRNNQQVTSEPIALPGVAMDMVIGPVGNSPDINGDGAVNVEDLLAVISAWGPCPTPPTACPADVAPEPNGDGQINVSDLLFVISNWS